MQCTSFSLRTVQRLIGAPTMNRPGECDTCLQLIGFQPSLEIYQESNTGNKPYESKQCGKPPVCPGSFGTGRVTHTIG